MVGGGIGKRHTSQSIQTRGSLERARGMVDLVRRIRMG
jgi:hypothetical protein